jgi:hypothetical protein
MSIGMYVLVYCVLKKFTHSFSPSMNKKAKTNVKLAEEKELTATVA